MSIYGCDECGKRYEPDEQAHLFSGYGFLVGFCPTCCPREVDGTECEREHPQ